MHEVGVISAMLKTLSQVMEEENLTHIDKVVLEIGELSGVIPHYMESCFPAAVYKTPFEDLQMEMEIVPGVLRCMNCQQEFEMNQSRLVCPKCGSDILAPVSGTSFIIKEIYGN